jgi:hypothetical protein
MWLVTWSGWSLVFAIRFYLPHMYFDPFLSLSHFLNCLSLFRICFYLFLSVSMFLAWLC